MVQLSLSIYNRAGCHALEPHVGRAPCILPHTHALSHTRSISIYPSIHPSIYLSIYLSLSLSLSLLLSLSHTHTLSLYLSLYLHPASSAGCDGHPQHWAWRPPTFSTPNQDQAPPPARHALLMCMVLRCPSAPPCVFVGCVGPLALPHEICACFGGICMALRPPPKHACVCRMCMGSA